MQRWVLIFSRGEGEIIESLREKHVKVFYPSLGFFLQGICSILCPNYDPAGRKKNVKARFGFL